MGTHFVQLIEILVIKRCVILDKAVKHQKILQSVNFQSEYSINKKVENEKCSTKSKEFVCY